MVKQGGIYTPEVWMLEEAHNVDLLVVSLKYGNLRGALEDIKTIVGEKNRYELNERS